MPSRRHKKAGALKSREDNVSLGDDVHTLAQDFEAVRDANIFLAGYERLVLAGNYLDEDYLEARSVLLGGLLLLTKE